MAKTTSALIWSIANLMRGPFQPKATEVIATLREYRSALITEAVTGKIDVREAVA